MLRVFFSFMLCHHVLAVVPHAAQLTHKHFPSVSAHMSLEIKQTIVGVVTKATLIPF